MTKYFRPFWFLNVEKIEAWLSYMAARGQHLVKLNFFPGTFAFNSGVPIGAAFRIGYMTEEPLPQRNPGWEEVYRFKSLYVVSNSTPTDGIKIFPAGNQFANRVLLIINRVMLIYYAALVIIGVGLVSYLALFVGNVIPWPVTNNINRLTGPSQLIVRAGIICLGGLVMLLSSISHKLLHKDSWSSWDLESPLAYEGFFVKRKLLWVLSPDKLEQWLEQMEFQGYCLHSIGKLGQSFRFTRSGSRKMKYCADFQLMADRTYFEIHEESGWKPVFAGLGSFGKWTIWAQEYEDQPPQFYTDEIHLKRHALMIEGFYSTLLIPQIIFLSTLIKFMADRQRSELMFFIVLYGIILILFAAITTKMWLYYRRMKKRASACN